MVSETEQNILKEKKYTIKEFLQGVHYENEVTIKEDGTIFFSDNNNSDGGFVYFYPRSGKRLLRILGKEGYQLAQKENQEKVKKLEEEKANCGNCSFMADEINKVRKETAEKVEKIIKQDILLFEDARDILIDLRQQGVGTGDTEKLFDKRVKELDKIFKEKTA